MPLALIGLFGVALAISVEQPGLAFLGVMLLVLSGLAQIVDSGRYAKKRHRADVRSKYEKLVAEHWKLTPPPDCATTAQNSGTQSINPPVSPHSEAQPFARADLHRLGTWPAGRCGFIRPAGQAPNRRVRSAQTLGITSRFRKRLE